MVRPIETLKSDEVDGRVEDAAMDEALNDHSFTSANLLSVAPQPEPKPKKVVTDVVDLDDFDLEDW